VKKLLSAIILVLAAVTVVTAVELPGYKGPINDLAGVLNAGDVQKLEAKVLGYRQQTGSEIAVLIVPTLGSQALEDYAYDVFKAWGIGQKDKNNGVLFLLAIEEKKARVEVGYGLEGDLTDLECGRLVSKNSPMAQFFREGDFAGGIGAVLDGIVVAIGGEYNPPKVQAKGKEAFPLLALPLLIGVGIMLNFFRRISGTNKKFGGRGGFGGPFIGGFGGFGGGSSGGGGGGFSFGGGCSGGGGASGGW
jgi:uncharacterized protein